MKVLNYGSLNVDNVYSVHHIVRGGETILSSKVEQFCGERDLTSPSLWRKRECPCTMPALWGRTAVCCWKRAGRMGWISPM